jgi:hypothetical protein
MRTSLCALLALRGATWVIKLPFGELISLGMALVTAIQIIDDWNEIWREADQVAAEGA